MVSLLICLNTDWYILQTDSWEHVYCQYIIGCLSNETQQLYDCIISLREAVWDHNTCLSRHFLLMCLYQARKVSDHVYVC